LLHVYPIRRGLHPAIWRPSYALFWVKQLHLLIGYFLLLMWIKINTQTSGIMVADTDTKHTKEISENGS
jgi:hypothetical protein